jgi:hypothetical protein
MLAAELSGESRRLHPSRRRDGGRAVLDEETAAKRGEQRATTKPRAGDFTKGRPDKLARTRNHFRELIDVVTGHVYGAGSFVDGAARRCFFRALFFCQC